MRLPGWRVDPSVSLHEPVLYGEPLFVAAVADQLGLAALEPSLNFLVDLPQQFRMREVGFGRAADIAMLDFPVFLKPADAKCFPAAVYQSAEDLASAAIPDATPVLWSEPVSWEVEFRCFIVNRRLLTLCPYVRRGELAQAADGSWPCTDEECEATTGFLRTLLSVPEVDLPPALVIDVGLIARKGWAVVEANPCWGSGIYGCEPRLVLEALRASIIPTVALRVEDRRWIASRIP